MRLKAFGFILLALLLTLFCVPVPANAMLALPHAFYGDVTITEDSVTSQAPAGTTTIEARGDGVLIGIKGNPVTTSELGKYGSTTHPEEWDLIVQGDITSGTEINFFVNGICTGTTFRFKSGETTNVDLAVEITSKSITGDVKKTIPPASTGYVVDASNIAGTTVTVNTTAEVTITVEKYYSNPHPDVPPPADMLPRYIDIKVDNLGAIIWPMYVEQSYTHDEIADFVEDSLKMYYFKDDAWHKCSDTGVNTAENYIWAKMTMDEVSGSPVAIGGTAAPEPEPEPTPAAGGGGGGGAPPLPAGTTDIRGMVSTAGVFYVSATAISEDGICELTIPAGAVGLTEELEPLTIITMLIMDEPPLLPEAANVIGLVYDFQPGGATFEPPITLKYSYDPADIPEGIAEEDLVIDYYDQKAGEWVNLEGTVHPETNTITALVSHFTAFAIIAVPLAPPPPPAPAAFSVTALTIQPAEVQPKEAATITISVANTGGTEGSYTVVLKIDGVKEAEKSVTIAAGKSQDASFSVSKEEAGSYSVDVNGLTGSFMVKEEEAVKPPVNWPLIGGLIAAAVLAGLLFFLIRRRAY